MVLRKILRHRWHLLASLALLLVLYKWLKAEHQQLQNVDYILGWILFGLALFMASYNLRKRLSVLPLGSNNSWYLLHLYGGFWCLLLFILHAGWTWPSSPVNQILWLASILILLSGLIGLALSKFLTPMISAHGERLIFDRIPGHISLNKERSEALMLAAAASKAGKPLVDYYHQKLMAFFNHSGQLGLKLFTQKKRLIRYLIELDEINRYLDKKNQQRLVKLKGLLKQKSLLDWQYSTLSLLRSWTLLHVPIIWFTLIFLLAHIIIHYAFKVPQPW